MSAIVLTSLGKIKGRQTRSKNGKQVFAFKAIPYGQPPVGELRFDKPQPAMPWQRTLDAAKKESPACLQVNVMSPESRFFIGQEDCLYLNVFTPLIPGGGMSVLLPVIVWIHGGAFCVGSNDSKLYGPELILDHGVVLVSINYRLGAFGFFKLGSAPGNQGMHDQVLALKWVQQHIKSFGGDPDNVTIMGESAGAMSCFLHLVSPLSQGLFTKIIALSGSPSTPFLHLDRKPECYSRAIGTHLIRKKTKRVSISDQELLKMLKNLPAKSIIEATCFFKDWDVVNPIPWKPTLDPDQGSEAFMPMPFEEAIRIGKFNKNIVIMAGCTSEEGLVMSSQFHRYPRRWRMLFNNWDRWAPLLLFNREYELLSLDDIAKVTAVRNKFFPIDNGVSSAVPPMKEGNLKIMEQLFSTAIFHAPMVKDLTLLSTQGVKIYPFEFSYKGTMTLCEVFRLPPMKLVINFFGRHAGTKLYQKDNLGVCHGDDLLYIFPFSVAGFPKTVKTTNDKRVSETLLGFISNFAAKDEPLGDDWPALNTNDYKVMRINEKCSFEHLEPSKMRKIEFWNSNINPNDIGSCLSDIPISKIYSVIAERRSSLLDSQQLFS